MCVSNNTASHCSEHEQTTSSSAENQSVSVNTLAVDNCGVSAAKEHDVIAVFGKDVLTIAKKCMKITCSTGFADNVGDDANNMEDVVNHTGKLGNNHAVHTTRKTVKSRNAVTINDRNGNNNNNNSDNNNNNNSNNDDDNNEDVDDAEDHAEDDDDDNDDDDDDENNE